MWQLLSGDHAFADALMRPDHGYASKRCAPLRWQSLQPCWPAVRTPPSSTRPSARRSRSLVRRTCRAMKCLEAQGAMIGKIELDVRQIFDERDPRENSGLYHLADQLHVRTRQSTIRAQLLFRPGDRYKARVLEETERNLRALAFIYDACVVPVKYADGKVTIRVITKDVWTLSPGVSFSRTGGSNSSGFDLSDSNLLGFGKSLTVDHSSNVDRTSNGIIYGDPNLFGSRWTLASRLCQRQRWNAAHLRAGAAFLFAGYPMERHRKGDKVRPHRVPLQPGRYRRSIQTRRELLRAERRACHPV